jgi:uncharacterized protein YaaN involved in tellurite resistance
MLMALNFPVLGARINNGSNPPAQGPTPRIAVNPGQDNPETRELLKKVLGQINDYFARYAQVAYLELTSAQTQQVLAELGTKKSPTPIEVAQALHRVLQAGGKLQTQVTALENWLQLAQATTMLGMSVEEFQQASIEGQGRIGDMPVAQQISLAQDLAIDNFYDQNSDLVHELISAAYSGERDR